MIQSPFGKLTRQSKRASDLLRWKILGSKIDSVYFYTLHKCASSLFAGYVLPNAVGLRHVHYARRIHRYSKEIDLRFENTGHVYGPIRLSADRESPVFKKFVQHINNPEFVRDKQVIFLVRDPREILVSAYFSFGFHHKLTPDNNCRQRQLAQRSQTQTMSIDDYALSNAEFFRDNFALIASMNQACKHSVILKYEDLVSDFDSFAESLSRFLQLKPSVIRHTFKVSRPKLSDKKTHRRSGQTRSFERKLRPGTIREINTVLADVLAQFEYEER